MKRSDRRASKMGKPDALTTPSPSPEQTVAEASQGIDINRGNSDQMPLSPAGVNHAKQLADQFAAKGGLSEMVTAPSVRTEQTAAPILAKNPQGQIPTRQEPGLESWAQGNLEGEPKANVQAQIRDLVRKNPSRVIPGQGAMSSMPGESFDQFKGRALPAVRGIMQQIAEGMAKDPNYKIGFPWHSQTSKVTKAWLAKDAPDDFSVDPREMEKPHLPPGTVERLFPDKDGKWELKPVDMTAPGDLPPGGYGILHTVTPQSADNTAKTDAQQTSLAKMVGAAQSMNFQGAQRHAKAASAAGMSDDDIGKYLDSALPDQKTASQLPMPHLLAVMAAAGPEKRQEYAPLLQSHFGGMSALSPHDQQALTNHISQMGYTPQGAV